MSARKVRNIYRTDWDPSLVDRLFDGLETVMVHSLIWVTTPWHWRRQGEGALLWVALFWLIGIALGTFAVALALLTPGSI